MRPVIGITCDEDWENRRAQVYAGYYEAVFRCGGQPFLIPCLEGACAFDILDRLDGLLLTGGQDVDAYRFGEEPHHQIGTVLPHRDTMELALSAGAVSIGLPTLGICRGIQVMNIALKGDIYQDLDSQWEGKPLVCHDQRGPKWFGIHEVVLTPESQIRHICGMETLRTNSFHHQAVRRLGKDLIASGFTRDGVIEALELAQHPFFIGVQWHPERMWERDPSMLALFSSLVKAAELQ